MKNIFGSVHKRTTGESKKEDLTAEGKGKGKAEISKEKEIVETLTYKLGISEDELHNYIDEL
jgi:hypothetical protein